LILWWCLELSVAVREVIMLLIKSDLIRKNDNIFKYILLLFCCNFRRFCFFLAIYEVLEGFMCKIPLTNKKSLLIIKHMLNVTSIILR